MAASAEAVGHDHDAALVFPSAVQVSGQLLSPVGGEGVFRAIQSFKILRAQHQRFITFAADIEVVVVHDDAEGAPSDDQQDENADRDGYKDLFLL